MTNEILCLNTLIWDHQRWPMEFFVWTHQHEIIRDDQWNSLFEHMAHRIWSHIDVFKQRIPLVVWRSYINVFKQIISLVVSEDLVLMCSNKEFHWSSLMISYWCVQAKIVIGCDDQWNSLLEHINMRSSEMTNGILCLNTSMSDHQKWPMKFFVWTHQYKIIRDDQWNSLFEHIKIPLVISDDLILMCSSKEFHWSSHLISHWCVQTKNSIGCLKILY
jgi:hypothetical protein